MLENLKLKVVEIAKKAEQLGFCKYKSGNFSIKEGKYILLTPSGIIREKMIIDDIIVMDTEGNIIEAKTNLKPSSEYLMHLEIYKQRPSLNSIVHTHSKFATSFAVANREILPVVSEAILIFEKDGKARVAPYATPGSLELAMNTANILKDYNVCLMEKHGAITASEKGLEDAFLKTQYLEEVAEIYYHSLNLINK